ncbi:MAG: hypothetical protein WCP46_00415 [Alphaproteobacteria bacterium]
MNHKEALKKIVEVTLDQSTANKIATEALQSESEGEWINKALPESFKNEPVLTILSNALRHLDEEQLKTLLEMITQRIPKSESRMYSEEEVEKLIASSWYSGARNHFEGRTFITDDNVKDILQSLKPKTEELKEGLNPCPNHPDVLISQCGICNGDFPKLEQPKTEEVERGWTITDAKEQPSPSIEKKVLTVEEILYPLSTDTSEGMLIKFENIHKVIGLLKQNSYKSNQSLDDLEIWVKEIDKNQRVYGILRCDDLLNKIQELKTKQ